MHPPTRHVIRQVRYDEFVALISQGAGDFDGFRAAADALLVQMGDDVATQHVLVDLRRATIPPLPETVLARALEYLRQRGLGVRNKVAVLTDPGDRDRTDRADTTEAVAAFLRMQVRSFRDYGAALEWLNEADGDRPGESAE
jgi:hypothetical protein